MSVTLAAEPAQPKPRLAAYPAYTLRDLLTSVFFHRRALLIAFVVPVVLGLLAALLSHTMYVSQARLLVLLGSEYVFQPQVGEAGSGMALDRDQIMQGELGILQSTTLRMETLRTLGLQHVYPDANPSQRNALELAADRMQHDLTFNSIPQSNVINITYRNRDPNVAAEVLRTLIAVYLRQRSAVFDRAPGDTFTAQRTAYQDRLRQAEDALTAFDQQHGITDYDEQMRLLVQQKADNSAEQQQVEARIRELEATVAAMRSQLATVPQTVQLYSESDRSRQNQGLMADLVRLESQRNSLLARYQDSFPLVQDVNRQIDALKAQIAQSPGMEGMAARSGRNPVYDQVNSQEVADEAELRGLQARRVELANAAGTLQARLDQMNALGQQYRDLRRARDVMEATLRNFEQNSEMTGLTDALSRTRAANVRVVQPPEPPPRGQSPRKLLLAGGVLLGLIAATAVLALLTALRQVFVTVEDAERSLDLPVLLAVPMREPGAPRRPSNPRDWVLLRQRRADARA